MPHTRTDPWYVVYGMKAPVGSRFSFQLRRRDFGDIAGNALKINHADPRLWFSSASDAAENHRSYPERNAEMMSDMQQSVSLAGNTALVVEEKSVLGRSAKFKAVVISAQGLGAVGYDGHDFFVAPDLRTLKNLIEDFTVRSGGERAAAVREILRYYELGGGYVVEMRLRKTTGLISIGKLGHDGLFGAAMSPGGVPAAVAITGGLDRVEGDCTDARWGIGEECWRATASQFAGPVWDFADLGQVVHGFAPVFDATGLVLGKRLEFKHGTILPALGSLGARTYPEPKHGTNARYSGQLRCRCSACVDAHRVYEQMWHEKAKGKTSRSSDHLKHGTLNAYSHHGCRCALCTAAHRRYQQKRKGFRQVSIPWDTGEEFDGRGVAGLGHSGSPQSRATMSATVETKWKRDGQKYCVVQFRWPGGSHREPIGPVSDNADDAKIVKRALDTAAPRIEQKMRWRG